MNRGLLINTLRATGERAHGLARRIENATWPITSPLDLTSVEHEIEEMRMSLLNALRIVEEAKLKGKS